MYPIKLQKTGMLTIQKVTVADCELINKMAGEVFPATYKEILSPEQLDYMMDWMYAPENIRKQMEEEGHVYFIAYKEGKPCGYVSVQQQEKDCMDELCLCSKYSLSICIYNAGFRIKIMIE